MKPVSYRAARAADQKAIRRLVRLARINPMGIKWPNFLVAEADGKIVGIGQVKVHRDGSRELASIAVDPAYRRQGIATALIQQLLSDEEGTLYLTCLIPMESFYQPFGFRRASGDELSGYMARIEGLNRWLGRLVSPFTKRSIVGIVMRREAISENAVKKKAV